VAIACNPATPAPNTSTSAGCTVPAAVILIGKNRRNNPAATTAHRYPDTIACDDNASIDCARDIRGTNSNANAVTPASRNRATSDSDSPTGKNETVTDPDDNSPTRSTDNGCTEHTTDAPPAPPPAPAATTSAPAPSYSASTNPAPSPAPGSTTTSCPAATNFDTASGANATRDSPPTDSLTT